MDYRFLVFSVMIFFLLSCRSFLYLSLLYCYQTDFPPHLSATAMEQQEYERFACTDKRRTQPSTLADSYHVIVSLLHYLLMTLNQ